jgi:hypothetical protein
MSQQITEAFVQQYKSNIFHLAQQKGSRLRGCVRSEMQNGKRQYFERLGQTAAILKTSRHMDTPQIDSAHSRRAVTLLDYIWADLIDDEDKIRLLIDPASPYSQAAMWAMGRAMDDLLIAAMRGNAYSGEEGTTAVPLPASQKVLAYTDGTPGTPTHLNIDTLRRVKKKFDANDIDESIPRYFAYTSTQLSDLLGETETTSSDFNTVKALVAGQIDTFMGFKFVRIERLPAVDALYDSNGNVDSAGSTLSNARRCLAWAGDGVVLALGKDMEAKIEKLPTKNYATQVFARMSIGATRIEENKVVEVVCSEA